MCVSIYPRVLFLPSSFRGGGIVYKLNIYLYVYIKRKSYAYNMFNALAKNREAKVCVFEFDRLRTILDRVWVLSATVFDREE